LGRFSIEFFNQRGDDAFGFGVIGRDENTYAALTADANVPPCASIPRKEESQSHLFHDTARFGSECLRGLRQLVGVVAERQHYFMALSGKEFRESCADITCSDDSNSHSFSFG
jgi:hypothetical protein